MATRFLVLQMWTSVSTCHLFAKMENVSTMMEVIGVNVRWVTNSMPLERSVLVSARSIEPAFVATALMLAMMLSVKPEYRVLNNDNDQ